MFLQTGLLVQSLSMSHAVTIKFELSLSKSYTNKSQIVILQESTMYNINNVNSVYKSSEPT